MTERGRPRYGRQALALVATAMGIVMAASLPASADDNLSRKEILADCASGTGKCTFNDPELGQAYLGAPRRVSDELHNCSTSDASQSMAWSDTVGSSDTAGVSITAGGKLAGLIDLSVTANYSHTWSSSHTESSTLSMTVKPGEVGWIARSQVMRTVSGTWQTHYDTPRAGHYFWYVPDAVTGPAPNGTDGVHNAVTVKTRPMTASEKASCSTRSVKTFRTAR
ncbi:hypothetical protein [Streptomyces olivoreticuli]|uniref:hypothetical protein n=1 Tax=Streptomyces olivoreticuli TaxID=68246 RepID=UPI000E25373B|nr:hypothetical protein [Streptomyces olivoreticuli]